MTRGENYLLAVFRRLGSSRDLGTKEEGEQTIAEHEHWVEKDSTAEEEKKEEIQPHSLQSEFLSLERAVSICEKESESEDDDEEEEEAEEEEEEEEEDSFPTTFPKDHINGFSKCSCSCFRKLSVMNHRDLHSCDPKDRDEQADKKVENPKIWKSGTSRLGWTPGQVKRVNNNRFIVEPVVALTDALEDICLDDSIIRAMAGKRGSFSSERSVRTEESDGSESKRARVWSSVFRTRGFNSDPL